MRRSPALPTDVVGGAEAQHHRRHVVAGIAVGDVAAERADIAHLRVGDQQRGLAQDRKLGGEQVGADDLVLRRHGADDDVAAVGADALEVADAGEIDEMRRASPAAASSSGSGCGRRRAAVPPRRDRRAGPPLRARMSDDGRRRSRVSRASSRAPGGTADPAPFLHCCFWREAARACAAATTAAALGGRRMHQKPSICTKCVSHTDASADCALDPCGKAAPARGDDRASTRSEP